MEIYIKGNSEVWGRANEDKAFHDFLATHEQDCITDKWEKDGRTMTGVAINVEDETITDTQLDMLDGMERFGLQVDMLGRKAAEHRAEKAEREDAVCDFAIDKLLPSGSGFDDAWDVSVKRGEGNTAILHCESAYEGMNEGGFYLSSIPFAVDIPMDDPDNFDIHDTFEQDIDWSLFEDEYQSKDELLSYLAETIQNNMEYGDKDGDRYAFLAEQAKNLGFATPKYDVKPRQITVTLDQEAYKALGVHPASSDLSLRYAFADGMKRLSELKAKEKAQPTAEDIYVNLAAKGIEAGRKKSQVLADMKLYGPNKVVPDCQLKNYYAEGKEKANAKDVVR